MNKALEGTVLHMQVVRDLLCQCCSYLLMRGVEHDRSKISPEEFPYFRQATEQLSKLTYGSEEYKESLQKLRPALEHHYAENRHHPEHYPNGIDDMNLIDILEMFCDWKASTLRHTDGSFEKSLDVNEKRFNISPQLMKILRNTMRDLDW